MSYPYYPALLEEIYRMMRCQCDRLRQLEQEISSIKEMLSQGASAGALVERIEYNFEQLKVENLNGALHIGIGSGEQLKIDDLFQKNQHAGDISLEGQESQGSQASNPAEASPQENVQTDVRRYIREEMMPLVHKRSKLLQVELSNEQIKSIVDDMIRQADQRIGWYMQQFQESNGKDAREIQETVSNRVYADIHAALDQYVEHFRKEEQT